MKPKPPPACPFCGRFLIIVRGIFVPPYSGAEFTHAGEPCARWVAALRWGGPDRVELDELVGALS